LKRIWSIRAQLLLLVLTVAVPLLGLVLYSAYLEVRQSTKSAYEVTGSVAQLTAAQVEGMLADSERILADLVERPLIRAVDPNQCDPIIYEMPYLFAHYAGTSVIDLEGNLVCSSVAPNESSPTNFSDRAYFQTAIETERFIVSGVVRGRLQDRWLTIMAYPIHDVDGRLAGILTVAIDLIGYQATLENLSIPLEGSVTILDSSGTVLGRSAHADRWIGERVGDSELVRRLLASMDSTTRGTGLDGVERLYSLTFVEGPGWLVYAGIPARLLYAPVQGNLIRLGLVAVAIVLLVSTLAGYLMWQLDRPVRSLVQVANEIAGGNLDSRAPLLKPREFRDVAIQFNRILNVNEEHRAELEYHARQLQALSRMGQDVAATLDLTELLQRVLEHLNRLLPAENIAVFLLQKEELCAVATYGPVTADLLGRCLPMNNGLAFQVIEQRQTVWLQGAHQAGEILDYLGFDNGRAINAVLAAPLQVGEKVMGMLTVIHHQAGAFNRDHLHLIETAASWTAIAVSNAQLFDQARRSREQMRRLARQVVTAQEEERQRVARELHDEAGQALTALKISLELSREDLPEELGEVRHQLADAAALTDQTMEQIRRLAHNLRPAALETYGLDGALQALCHDFESRTNLPVTYQASSSLSLPDSVAITLYRFVQEALTNVAKHAGAGAVAVRVDCDDAQVRVVVHDNGRGFDLNEDPGDGPVPTGIGLTGMRERLDLIGGWLLIQTGSGAGTRLEAYVPLEEPVATANNKW
jgi:signal transduction histidine kinase